MSTTPDIISIAQVGRPVGLDGWCRIFPTGGTLERANYPLTAQCGAERPEFAVTLLGLRGAGGNLQARFKGYENRDKIEDLKNLHLYLPLDTLPPVTEGEFYHFELVGMTAIGKTSGREYGTVKAVHNYPTTDALEIRNSSGLHMDVPFRDEAVPEIDREKQIVYLDDTYVEDLLT